MIQQHYSHKMFLSVSVLLFIGQFMLTCEAVPTTTAANRYSTLSYRGYSFTTPIYTYYPSTKSYPNTPNFNRFTYYPTTSNDYWRYEINETSVIGYNEDSQRCCDGTVFDRKPNSYHKCCGDSDYDTTSQICCANKVYNLKPKHACCDSTYFSIEKGICCYNYIHQKYRLHSFPEKIIESPSAWELMQCCGLQVIDTRTHICCFNGYLPYTPSNPRYDIPQLSVWDRKYPNSICCNGRVHNKESHNCTRRNYMPTPPPSYQSAIYYTTPGPERWDTCNDQKYKVDTHLCCSTYEENRSSQRKLHERISLSTMCCGLESYDADSQLCCNRTIHDQNAERTLQCCGAGTSHMGNEICCANSNVSLLIKDSNLADGCCGSEKTPFDSENQICCGNAVFDVPNEPGQWISHRCCWDPDSNVEPKMFNPDKQICCGGIVHEFSDDNKRLRCCGEDAYDSSKTLCCSGTVLARTNGSNSCCGKTVFNTLTELCCGSNQDGQVVHSRNFTNSCCGNRIFNHELQICCYNSQSNFVRTKPSARSACCNGTAYDSNTHECCDNQLQHRNSQLCCWYNDTMGFGGHVIRKGSPNDVCCGSSTFDYTKQRCCNNNVVDLSSPSAICCGSTSYEPGKQLCCHDTVHEITPGMSCCGRKSVLVNKELCCRGVVISMDDMTDAQCCYKATAT